MATRRAWLLVVLVASCSHRDAGLRPAAGTHARPVQVHLEVTASGAIDVHVSVPRSLLGDGAWQPKLRDVAAARSSGPMALEDQGAAVEVRCRVVPEALASTRRPDVLHLAVVEGGGLVLPLSAVVPVFSSGQRTVELPGAEVTVTAVGQAVESTLEQQGEGFRASSARELYSGLVLVGSFASVPASASTRVLSPSFSAAQLEPLASLVRRSLESIEARLGPARPLSHLVVLPQPEGQQGWVGRGVAGEGHLIVLLDGTPLDRATSATGLLVVHELIHFAMPDGLGPPVNEAITETAALRVSTDLEHLGADGLRDLVRSRWSRFIEKAAPSEDASSTLLRYYGGPALVTCMDVPLQARGTGIEALVRASPQRDGRKQPSDALRLVEAELEGWLEKVAREPSTQASLLERCLERSGLKRAPAPPAVGDQYLARIFRLSGFYEDGEAAGARVAVSAGGGGPLRGGDVVVAVEALPVYGAAHLREVLAAVASKPEVELTVLRAGVLLRPRVRLPAVRPADLSASTRASWVAKSQ